MASKMKNDDGILLEFGKCRLDIEKKILWCGEKPVGLPLKAIELLCVLVGKGGEVATKDEIWREVWQDAFIEETNLTHNIYLLRKTFKELGESDLIETVPRRGYRFAGDVSEIRTGELVIEKFTQTRTLIQIQDEKLDDPVLDTDLSRVKKQRFSVGSVALIVLVFIFLSAVAFWSYETSLTKTDTDEIRSIAVLPFKSFDSNADDESLRLRITDALITRLGSFKNIAVRPTNAILAFSGKENDALDIGRQLQTDAVLDGRIQQENQQIRVTLQLIRVADGKQIWAEKFDGQDTNILDLQDSISSKLLVVLNLPHLSEPQAEFAKRPTTNSEAFEEYLKGRFFLNKRTKEGYEKSVSYFEKAISLDSKFATAYVGLADAHIGFYEFALRSADETIPNAERAVEQAILINPNLAEAFRTKGYIESLHDWNWEKADQSFQKSIEINPNDSVVHARYGWSLIIRGKFEDALVELEKARELDPLSPTINGNIGYTYFCSRNYPKAIEHFQKVIETNPDFSAPIWYLGAALIQEGKINEGYAEYQVAALVEGDKELSEFFARVREPNTEKKALKKWIAKSINQFDDGYYSAYNIALLYSIIKDKNEALNWIEKSYAQHDSFLLQIAHEPEFDILRDEPRFKAVLEKLNLTER